MGLSDLAQRTASHPWTTDSHTSWRWGRHCPGCDRSGLQVAPGAVRGPERGGQGPGLWEGREGSRHVRKRRLLLAHCLCS